MPDYETLMRPVLEAFAEREAGVKDLLPGLAERFELTAEDFDALLPSGRTTVLASRAHWARTYLAKAGLLESPRRGRHRITDAGRALLRAHGGPINNGVLSQFEGFGDWRLARTASDDAETTEVMGHEVHYKLVPPSARENTPDTVPQHPPLRDAESLTPAEVIAAAHRELTAATVDELLHLVRSMDPTRFEQVIVDLLLAMGYGGGDRSMGRQLGRSGDGGIDGVIDEDALGLDAVYIQAKRYAPGNTVGRPAIQQFIGSLTGEGATKGVFVTTSTFSNDATAYVDRVQQRVVLIDGIRLARLMIQHDVGVRTRQTYAVKTVDEDYFADPEA